MCGFSGLLTANHQHPKSSAWKEDFVQQSGRIAHRGSDDARLLSFDSVSLNHFRLAFQDLQSGRQPMLSKDGAFAITFNGEIYNHHDLRRKLDGKYGARDWRTQSDTETILQGWLLSGDTFADELEGEFAFVIVKTDGSSFFAARDFFGVKPLFFQFSDINSRMFSEARKAYSLDCQLVAFASEMKALPAEKIWNRDGALRQFTGLFEPICTPFEGIIQCPAGGRIRGHKQSSEPIYSIQVTTRSQPVRNAGKGAFWSGSDSDERLDEFRSALAASVEERLLSDVELGVYQSGGIDSKTVAFELAAALKRKSSGWLTGSMKSFTVGFETQGYDESDEAVAFSRHLGFTPHVLRLSEEALRYSYPHAVYISENLQPFTNGAAKWWLSLFARRYVPGVLTGDGADELLCGYPSFRYCAWWAFSQRSRTTGLGLGQRWRDTVYIKRFASQSSDPWLAGSSAEGRGDDFVQSLAKWQVPHPLFGQISAICEAILGPSEASVWLASQTESIRSWFLHGIDCGGNQDEFLQSPENALLLWQNYFCQTHLPVQILNWVGDRMEMANTLEGRTPFLSGKMRRFTTGLPDVSLVQGFLDKAVLRKTYARVLPSRFIMTPKKQFNAPFLNFESLYNDFSAESQLARMGLDATTSASARALLMESKNPLPTGATAQEKYLRTHKMSALQTLICSAIVQRTIIEKQTDPRNWNFEEKIISMGGPLS